MLRRLLTLLAVFAGFVSLVEPVQAARMDAGVEATASAERVSACTTAMLVETRRIARADGAKSVQVARCTTVQLAELAPTVRLQVDRARE